MALGTGATGLATGYVAATGATGLATGDVAATGLVAGDADGPAIQRVSLFSSVKDTDELKGIVYVNILASFPTNPPLASKEMAAWPEGHPPRARLASDLEPDTEFERVLIDLCDA